MSRRSRSHTDVVQASDEIARRRASAARPWHAGRVIDRRELLAGLGIASASTLLSAFGCSGAGQTVRRADGTKDEVRAWLRDAVERIAAVHTGIHVLAVRRHRTVAALDSLGMGIARSRRDGVVLRVRGKDGVTREQVTSDLTGPGILAAVRTLLGTTASTKARVPFPPQPAPPSGPAALDDRGLGVRLARINERDRAINSRVVYAAATIDIDEATVWSISPSHDREQRTTRVIKRVTRAAWNGTRPIVSEGVRGWTGGVDDQDLDRPTIEHATEMALLLVTPGAFAEKTYRVVLDPALTAALIDASVHALLTTAAARRPEVQRRLQAAAVASPLLTLVDDPTAKAAYGGFTFDDDGEPARPIKLLDAGRVVNVLGEGRGRRAGHVGAIEPSASHLRLSQGIGSRHALYDSGLVLEGLLDIVVDRSTSRVVIGAARARELASGQRTGRVWADVELVGELPALLAGVDGIAGESRTIPLRDERDGEPTWRSVEAPFVRTTGLVRARRRRA